MHGRRFRFYFGRLAGLAGGLAGATSALHAQSTISLTERYAYGANIGWLDARPSAADGARLTENVCSGYLYSANVGWINLGDGTPADGEIYRNDSAADHGVNVATYHTVGTVPGALSGYAYGANIGWIHFGVDGAPRVDLETGRLSGHAYSANAGWINLGEFSLSVAAVGIAPAPDTDGDGIADAWERDFFDGLAAATAFTDFDGDGLSDLGEYAADTDPTDRADSFRITAFVLNPAASPDLATVTFTSKPTRRYRLEYALTLGNPTRWTDSALGLFAPDGGPATTRAFGTADTPSVFVRAKTQRPLAP